EVTSTEAEQLATASREAERQSVAVREDLMRKHGNLERELAELESRLARFSERLAIATTRRDEIDRLLGEGSTERQRLDESLLALRARLGELEAEQEVAREARTEWQVQEAHLAARLRAARETGERAERVIAEAERVGRERAEEIARLEADSTELEQQRSQWQSGRDERSTALMAL